MIPRHGLFRFIPFYTTDRVKPLSKADGILFSI